MKRLFKLSVFLLTFISFTLGQMHEGGEKMKMHGGKGCMTGDMSEGPHLRMFLHHSDELGLSDEQVNQIQNILAEFEKLNIRKSADIDIAKVELSQLKNADKVDLSKVKSKVKSIASMKGELTFEKIKAFEGAKEVLTPEQRMNLKDSKGCSMCGKGMGGKMEGMMNKTGN